MLKPWVKRGATGMEWTWRWATTSKTQDENARAGWLWMTPTQLYLEPRSAQCVFTRKSVLWHVPGSVFCVHSSVAFSESRLTGRENATFSKKNFWMAVRGRGSYRECFLWSILLRCPWASFVLQELLHRLPLVWPLIILPAVLLPSFPSRRPLVWAPPGCRRPLRRGWWGGSSRSFVKYCSQSSLRHSRILGSNVAFNRFLPVVGICTIIHFPSRLSLDLGYRSFRFLVSWSSYQRHALQTFLHTT